MTPADPTSLGGFEIVDVLARGGMAVVYLARDVARGRPVAVKRILPEALEDPEFRDRFEHEVRIHSRIVHPNVLSLYAFGESADGPYIAMELADGGTLRTLTEAAGPLPPEAVLFAAREVFQGLAAAHEMGVVHRDVKPQNVLLTLDGGVKVGDFGISKTSQMTRLTQTGSVVGTPAYMSPEQALARPLGPASDLFSTGVMLYEALSGRNPFETDNPATTLRQILDLVPPSLFAFDPTVPAEVELLVDRLLAKEPASRPESAAEAARQCGALLRSLGEEDPRGSFASLLADPLGHLAARASRLSREHLDRARRLVSDGRASDEVALWEAFLAHRHLPESPGPRALVFELLRRTGYRLEVPVVSPRVKELEARLSREPDAVPLLLQLAKLAKLEKDFVRTMRYFLRLRALDVTDPYLRSQVASLVARGGAAPPEAPPEPAPAASKPPSPASPAAAPARPPAAPPNLRKAPAPPRDGRTVFLPEREPTRRLRIARERWPLVLIGAAAAAAALAGLLAFLR